MRNSYKGIWWLLAVAFVLFFGYSAFGDDLVIAGHPLRRSDLFSSLLGTQSQRNAVQTPVRVTAEEIAAAAPESPAPVDTLPKTILFIGDSMLEGLSPRLAAYCAESGHTLYTVIWYSSTSQKWGSSDRLRSYIGKVKPDFIFLCLGANELFVTDIINKRTHFVKRILNDIGDVPYLWIGPPNWKEDTGINRMIADNAAPGSFFLSDGMHFDRKSDGAHPTQASAALWLDSVLRWMPANHSHPIRLSTPAQKSARPRRVFIHQPDE